MNAFSFIFRQFCEHFKCISIFLNFSRPAFTCSKLTTERLEQGMKYVPSQQHRHKNGRRSGIFINFEYFTPCPVSIIFEHVITRMGCFHGDSEMHTAHRLPCRHFDAGYCFSPFLPNVPFRFPP